MLFRSGSRKRRIRRLRIQACFTIICFLLCATAIVALAVSSITLSKEEDEIPVISNNADLLKEEQVEPEPPKSDEDNRKEVLEKAEALAVKYNYDGAIALIQEETDYFNFTEYTQAIQQYEEIKATLVEVDITDIPHFFTHPLIYDEKVVFASE